MRRLLANKTVLNVLFNNVTKVLVDRLAGIVAFIVAFQIRFEGALPGFERSQMWFLLLPVATAHAVANFAFGAGRQKWRYIGGRDALTLLNSHGFVTGALLVARFALPEGNIARLAVGVIIVEFLLSLFASAALRLLWRILAEKEIESALAPRRVLILGAGYHGVTVAREMARHHTVDVLGFLDDDPQKHGAVISGIKVLGPLSDLAQLTKSLRVDEALICIPPDGRTSLDTTTASESPAPRMTVVPSIAEVLEGHYGAEGEAPSNGRNGGSRANGKNGAPAVAPRVKALAPSPASTIRGQKILLTGGAGFIGSSLARRLADNNKLILFDAAFDRKPLQFTNLVNHPNVKLVQGDILDEDALRDVSRDVDMVVHMAAVLGVGKVCSAARETLETNYVGTSRLLRAIEKNSRILRFVYFSTSEVFGANSYRVGESAPPMVGPIAESRWSYSMAKLAGEHLVQSYFREADLPTVIVRPFNVFGPRRTGDYALLRFIVSALTGKPLIVHGDGSQIRSWCFIEDFCDALVAVLERPEAVGQDFNIGNPANTITVKDLARRVIDIAGSDSSIQFVENPFPDIQIRVPSLEKAQNLLGYNPRYDLDTALAATIDWHRQNWEFFSRLTLPDYAAAAARASDNLEPVAVK